MLPLCFSAGPRRCLPARSRYTSLTLQVLSLYSCFRTLCIGGAGASTVLFGTSLYRSMPCCGGGTVSRPAGRPLPGPDGERLRPVSVSCRFRRLDAAGAQLHPAASVRCSLFTAHCLSLMARTITAAGPGHVAWLPVHTSAAVHCAAGITPHRCRPPPKLAQGGPLLQTPLVRYRHPATCPASPFTASRGAGPHWVAPDSTRQH